MSSVLLLGPNRIHSRRARITSWVLGVALGMFFVSVAVPKLMGAQFERDAFETWGYPLWFMYVVGVGEAALAIMLFFPQTRFWAAGLICLEMIGAAVTHLRVGQITALPMPGITFALAAWLAWVDRPILERYQGSLVRTRQARTS